jgi:hypothetical protein
MQFPSVKDVIIMKPRKDGSTYFAPLAFQNKTQVFTIELSNVQCIRANSLYIKNKAFMNYMVDLNEHIVETVKDKCASWFNSSMSTDLIDEYFVNPLKYDKEHGYLVKVDCDDIDKSHEKSHDKYNLTIEVRGLRFLKQKFNIEWAVINFDSAQAIEFNIDDTSDVSEEEDIPEPIPEDVNDMKEKYTITLSELVDQHKSKADEARKALSDIEAIIQKLESSKNDITSFNSLAEFFEIDDFIESLQNE